MNSNLFNKMQQKIKYIYRQYYSVDNNKTFRQYYFVDDKTNLLQLNLFIQNCLSSNGLTFNVCEIVTKLVRFRL